MSCFPLRLGVFAGLLALLVTGAVPAHARHTARNPNNPEQNQVQQGTPDQTVNTVPAQADQPQYGGYVPSAYPPSSAGQPSSRPQYVPQYQPNAYIGTVPPSTSGAPNQYPNQTPNQGRPGGSPVPSPQASAPAAQSSSAIGIADQYPPKPPRVSFRNGQLSIIAENSTLPDILTAIHQRTGAAMELPTTLGNERVAVKLGPASTGDVLASLLNGSHFDYIVLNRPEDPSSPERIILREKVAADSNANANNNGYNNGYNNMASAQPAYQPQPEVQEMPETTPDEEVPEQETAPGQQAQDGTQPGDQNQGNAKTPEQLLEELRQMQQQRGQPQPQLQPQQPPLVDNGQPQ